MAHAGSTEDETAVLPLESVSNHRMLVAATFPRSVNEAMTNAPAVTIEDQAEMLHCAASQGMLSSVLALISEGRVSCDVRDRFGRTPLHWAAEQGHRNVALALITAKACVDARSQRNLTPVMLAASRGHNEVVEMLLRFRAGGSDGPLNCHRDLHHWRSTGLHDAAASGRLRLVEALVDAGFDREEHDDAGLTPAEVCVRMSHSTAVAITHNLLPSEGGDMVRDTANTMAQGAAMSSGRVKGGSFLDWQDKVGDTPLHRAVEFHHATISKLLLREGADPNIRDHGGASPLHIASRTGREDIVADLLEAGANTELLTVENYSPLHVAVAENRMNVVHLLLNARASTEHRDAIHDQTALSSSCRNCLAPMVRVLVEAGADVESRSWDGLTPLHWACRFNSAQSVEALLSAGADPCAIDQVARDAVAASSSSSGTIVSMPIAIDVIGLGYPPDPTEDSAMVATRRLDVVTVGRIESALHDAKQERSWRRRGWLVIVANRRTEMEARVRAQHNRCANFWGCREPIKRVVVRTGCVCRYIDVEGSPCPHQTGDTSNDESTRVNEDESDNTESCPSQENSSNKQNAVSKKPRTFDSVVTIATATPNRQGQTRGNIGAEENIGVLRPDLLSALLELASVEVGIFRRIVVFV